MKSDPPSLSQVLRFLSSKPRQEPERHHYSVSQAWLTDFAKRCRAWLVLLLAGQTLAQTVQVTPVGQWPSYLRLPAYKVAVSGQYAYVAAGEVGLQVMDMSNPANPVRVGGYDTLGSAFGVQVIDRYAYVADGQAGLQVIDVSNPANPIRVGGFGTLGNAYDLVVVDQYAYVADGVQGMLVLDVSNPAKPVRVGRYDTPGVAFSVVVVDRYAYVADDNQGLQILDISSPANPVGVASYDTPGQVRGVTLVGKYAYVADWGAGLQVLDVSNPTNPVRVGSHETPRYVSDVKVVGSHAYVANGEWGLQILDINNPTNPVRVGGYDTLGEVTGVTVVGKYAYVADGRAGLQVMDVSNPANPARVGGFGTKGSAVSVQVVDRYAYVAYGKEGLQILDIGNPANPARVGGQETPGYVTDVKVAGNYAYVANGEWGLQILDISNPANPVRVAGFDTSGSALAVAVAGHYAYVAVGGAGLQVINVSNPANPFGEGCLDMPGEALGVVVVDRFAYVAYGSDGLQILDIVDPANPVRVGGYYTPGRILGVAVAGQYAYAAYETYNQFYQGAFLVIDVNNPANPAGVGVYEDVPSYTTDVAIVGRHAYAVAGDAGLRVIDVSNPAKPIRVGSYDTPGFAYSVAVAGQYAYVADGEWGLQILRIDGLTELEPVLAVLRAGQRPGTTLVEVEYELVPAGLGPADVRATRVSVAFSRDGGASFDIVPAADALSGEVGAGVAPGRRRFTWDAGKTLAAGTYGSSFVARLTVVNPYGTATAVSGRFALDLRLGTVHGLVVAKDVRGATQGPLSGAVVELAGVGSRTTGADGTFAFSGLAPGTYTVTASKPGYLSAPRQVTLRAGESQYAKLELTVQPAAGAGPTVTDFASPQGRYFIPGLPGDLTFTAEVAWNGSPGTVRFRVAGEWQPATVTDLDNGRARAFLTIPAPATIPTCSELALEVSNGNGQTQRINAGIYFVPQPLLVGLWYRDNIPWTPSGLAFTYSEEYRWQHALIRPIALGPAKFESFHAGTKSLRYDALAGQLSGELRGSIGLRGKTDRFQALGIPFRVLGEAQGNLGAGLEISLAGCDSLVVSPHWTLGASGKFGFGVPTVAFAGFIVPATAPVINFLLGIPVVADAVSNLETRFYLVVGLDWVGRYPNLELGDNPLLLWAKTVEAPVATAGLEIQSLIELRDVVVVALYGGGTVTFPPRLPVEIYKVRGYFGGFAELTFFRYKMEIGVEYEFSDSPQEPGQAVKLAKLADSGTWQPIGSSYLCWGEANRLAEGAGARGRALHGPGETGPATEQVVVENVIRGASPVVVAGATGTLVGFVWQDPHKPWHAATDIGLAWQPAGGAWALGRLLDDAVAEFSPRLTAAGPDLRLGAWVRVVGDVSGATGPEDIPPHFEVLAAWQDAQSGVWTAPVQLTTNAVVDRNPLPVVFGATRGVVWVQNAGTASPGHPAAGDRLLFSRWTGSAWTEPAVLWAADRGVLGLSFAADAAGQGHLVFAVDEDGDLDTREDRELYALSTANGQWQPARRLTQDTVEDAIPVLVAPNGVPRCVWRAGGQLTYTALSVWQPRPAFEAQTPANEAPSLDGVTLPGGAAVAYAVQGTNGVDIVASFYDATLDRWSLPRQLTFDEHAESALSLDFDGRQLVLAYLKTQTVRTNVEVEINGQRQVVPNVPQPGRTDLCLLRQTLGQDLAVEAESFRLEPAEPAPGSNATLRATVVNRGELPLTGVRVAFYDGAPGPGAVLLGEQTLAEPLVGGASRAVAVPWTVPSDGRPRDLYVVADPALALEDRDRGNNLAVLRALRPELSVETCWSDPVSDTAVLLVARVRNTGPSAAGPFEVAWRLGAANGAELGRRTLQSLAPGAVAEIAFIWETGGRRDLGEFSAVHAVADAGAAIEESDETNNAYAQTVRVIPGWVPRLVEARLLANGRLKLVFTASGGTATDFALESTESLSGQVAWETEAGVVITESAAGRFETELERRGSQRYYRVRAVR